MATYPTGSEASQPAISEGLRAGRQGGRPGASRADSGLAPSAGTTEGGTGSKPSPYASRHQAAEQRRRARINERWEGASAPGLEVLHACNPWPLCLNLRQLMQLRRYVPWHAHACCTCGIAWRMFCAEVHALGQTLVCK